MDSNFECDLRWDDLVGESNMRRHCDRCDRNVYNLSGMTREQAARLIRLHEGAPLCIHYVRRDGRIVHEGDPLQQLRSQRQGSRRLVAAAMAVHAAFAAIADRPAEALFDPFKYVVDALRADPVEEKFYMGANAEIETELVF